MATQSAPSAVSIPAIVDDKTPLCVPFIQELLEAHRSTNAGRPFIIGLNGVQGIGKTTLVQALSAALRQEGLQTLVCSLDDFYLTHEDQVALANAHPDNLLVQCRGEPGTHDMKLAGAFFAALLLNKPTKVPQYDKSAFSGQGDRVPESQWQSVNDPGQPKVEVIIFEGWSVGFRSLSSAEVERKWRAPSRTLQQHKLEHVQFINERLKEYDTITDLFDAFVHIDAGKTEWVYDWRLEQEVKLRQAKGEGMTDEQVIKFVDAYYPAYELYADELRNGLFRDRPNRQLRMVVSKDRRVADKVIM